MIATLTYRERSRCYLAYWIGTLSLVSFYFSLCLFVLFLYLLLFLLSLYFFLSIPIISFFLSFPFISFFLSFHFIYPLFVSFSTFPLFFSSYLCDVFSPWSTLCLYPGISGRILFYGLITTVELKIIEWILRNLINDVKLKNQYQTKRNERSTEKHKWMND